MMTPMHDGSYHVRLVNSLLMPIMLITYKFLSPYFIIFNRHRIVSVILNKFDFFYTRHCADTSVVYIYINIVFADRSFFFFESVGVRV